MRQLPVIAILLFTITSLKADTLLSENFNDINTLPGSGWVIQNNSTAPAATSWFQGNPVVFPAQSGPTDSYAAANYLNAAFAGDISDWLITPTLSLTNGAVISFYTRSDGALPDRLELRLSTNGSSSDVGASESSVGDFTTLLLSVNPTLTEAGYPSDWALETVTITDLAGPTSGRLALRYFVADTSANGDYIGVDTFSVTSTSSVPEPAGLSLLVLGGAVSAIARLRKKSFTGKKN